MVLEALASGGGRSPLHQPPPAHEGDHARQIGLLRQSRLGASHRRLLLPLVQHGCYYRRSFVALVVVVVHNDYHDDDGLGVITWRSSWCSGFGVVVKVAVHNHNDMLVLATV